MIILEKMTNSMISIYSIGDKLFSSGGRCIPIIVLQLKKDNKDLINRKNE